MEAIQYLFISASLILAGVSLLLKHFFNDADYYRSFCAELRAKYILTNTGPMSLLSTNPDKKVEILQDFLKFRLVRLHFGIVNFIIISGLGLIIAVLASATILGFHFNKINEVEYFYFFSRPTILLTAFCLIVQIAFARQSYKTAERICNLTSWDLNGNGSFEDQCSKIVADNQTPVNRQTKIITGPYKWITKATILLYYNFWSIGFVLVSDFLFLAILCPKFFDWFKP